MTTTQSKRKTFPARINNMAEQLRNRIVEGQYAPESLLPSELELGKQYGLSNKSVRKVLEQLKAEGLIEKIPRVGSVVKMRTSAAPTTTTLRIGIFSILERDIRLSRLIEDFERQHPSMCIETVPVPFPANIEALRYYLTSGFLDGVTLYDEYFHKFIESGCTSESLEPMNRQEGIYAFLNDTFSDEGVLYAQPVVFSPVVLAYNVDHFREAGLLEPDGSWTWADAIGHATRLAVPGQRHGLYFYAQSDNRWPVFLLQSGSGFEPGEDGHYRLEGTKMMDNMKLCKAIIRNTDIFPTDHFLESDSDVSELFEQGKVSMMVTTYMSLNSFSAGRVRYDISPVPYAHEPRTLVNVIGIAVNRHSANKQAARCLADYLVSQRAQRLIREHTLSIPALKPVAESLSIVNKSPGSLPRFHMFRDIMAGYRMHRDLRLSTTAFGELRHLLKRYWSGLIDDEQLCKEVDAVVTGNR